MVTVATFGVGDVGSIPISVGQIWHNVFNNLPLLHFFLWKQSVCVVVLRPGDGHRRQLMTLVPVLVWSEFNESFGFWFGVHLSLSLSIPWIVYHSTNRVCHQCKLLNLCMTPMQAKSLYDKTKTTKSDHSINPAPVKFWKLNVQSLSRNGKPQKFAANLHYVRILFPIFMKNFLYMVEMIRYIYHQYMFIMIARL